MPKVLLDTNFILACTRNKIDFIEDLQFLGLQILIPKQVFGELDNIIRSKQKLHNKDNASLAIRILEKSEDKFEEVDLRGSYLDNALVEYAKKHRDTVIATLDQELKKKIPNQKLAIREKKRFEIV